MKLAVGRVMKAMPRPKKSQCYWTKIDTCLSVLFVLFALASVIFVLVFHGKYHEGYGHDDSSSGSSSRSDSNSGSESQEEMEFEEQRMPHHGYREAKCKITEIIDNNHMIQCGHTDKGEWCDANILLLNSEPESAKTGLPDWIQNIQEQLGSDENGNLINNLLGQLGENPETIQTWMASLGFDTHDLLAQLMEHPQFLDEILESNPEVLQYLLDNDPEMVEGMCELLPSVVEKLIAEHGEWVQEFVAKLRKEHPDMLERIEAMLPGVFPGDGTLELGPMQQEDQEDNGMNSEDEDKRRKKRQAPPPESAESFGDRDGRGHHDGREGHHGEHHDGDHHGGHRGHPHGGPHGGHHGRPEGADAWPMMPEMPAIPGDMHRGDSTPGMSSSLHSSPCSLVTVEWRSHRASGQQMATLHKDLDSAQRFPQCTFASCESDDVNNNKHEVEEEMEELREKLEEDEEFKCYVHPDHPDMVLLDGPGHKKHCMRHAWFWSALVAMILMGILLTRRIYFSCCKKSPTAEKVMPERMATYAVVVPEVAQEEEKKPLEGPVVSAFPTSDMSPSNVYVPQTLYAVAAPPAYQALDVTGLMGSSPEEKLAPLDSDVSAVHKYMLLQEQASNEANDKKVSLA